MKIFFRYLFVRLVLPFFVVLLAFAMIWIMVNLYGNIDDFLDHKVSILLILRFYALQIPVILVQVLPATLLISVLWTMLSLNRRSELVAFQSGGMSPLWLFSPFLVFAVLWMIILGFDLSGPAPLSAVTGDRLLLQVKGQDARRNVFLNLPYVDAANGRVWLFQSLDTNRGKGTGVELLFRDAAGRDLEKYVAAEARWNGEFWKFTGVRELIFAPDGSVQDQKSFEELDLPDVTTPPSRFSLIVSQPDQLTVPQLTQYIKGSTQSPEYLAKYRTEWWYRILYPITLVVLLLFALVNGMRTDRSSAVAGVAWTIVVLVVYIMVMSLFLTAGRLYHLPPFLAVTGTEFIFGAIGLHLLALNQGWWWQLWEWWKKKED